LVRCARALFWLQKSARSVGPREATSVAAGVGDGGLALERETAWERKVVWRPAVRRRVAGQRVREGPLAGGRRLGPGKPAAFTGCWWKRSWSGKVGCSHPGLVGDRGVRVSALSGPKRSIAGRAARGQSSEADRVT